MEQKKHFKLYKSGKQWITAAIATIAVSTGIILGEVAQADTIDAADNQSVATQPISDQQTIIIVITINKHKPKKLLLLSLLRK
ncbi:KxYKxGKxW signal peptide domain-containing protein [Limosilactobacillus reuteri]|uniref:KxYKxGKxW signal peptide domain-containing protein n=1 Tax=Limosilactobacillus reuteri TaxID=1598 RepID=UPI003514B47C